MPWRPILFGLGLGYFLATSSLPKDVMVLARQILNAENKASMGIVALAILAAYSVLILLPLCLCSNRERAAWKEIDPSVRTSATANLRRRGSLGHLEFLQPALRTNLLANAMRAGGASGRDSRESPPPSARSDDGDSPLNPTPGEATTTAIAKEEETRRPRRARLYSGDAAM